MHIAIIPPHCQTRLAIIGRILPSIKSTAARLPDNSRFGHQWWLQRTIVCFSKLSSRPEPLAWKKSADGQSAYQQYLLADFSDKSTRSTVRKRNLPTKMGIPAWQANATANERRNKLRKRNLCHSYGVDKKTFWRSRLWFGWFAFSMRRSVHAWNVLANVFIWVFTVDTTVGTTSCPPIAIDHRIWLLCSNAWKIFQQNCSGATHTSFAVVLLSIGNPFSAQFGEQPFDTRKFVESNVEGPLHESS